MMRLITSGEEVLSIDATWRHTRSLRARPFHDGDERQSWALDWRDFLEADAPKTRDSLMISRYADGLTRLCGYDMLLATMTARKHLALSQALKEAGWS